MDTSGKYLTDLTQEMNGKGRYALTVFDDQSCISWGDDGTLAYFDYEDGFPGVYWNEWSTDNREDFTSFERFVAFLKRFFTDNEYTDKYIMYLLSSPVWRTKQVAQRAQTVTHLKLVK